MAQGDKVIIASENYVDGKVQTDVPAGAVFTDTIVESYNQEETPTPTGLGATWYLPSTGVLYRWVNDGATDVWIDISTAGAGVSQSYVDDADALKVDVTAIGTTVLAQDDTLERLDKVIARQDIVAMVYTGGSNSDKLSGIEYTNNYDEVFSYDGSDRLQYIDHQIGEVNQSYSTLVYNGTSGKLETVSYTATAR